MQGDRATAPSSKPKPKKKPVVKAPAGDIASSGGDYGKGEADAYKKTKEYKGAVREGYKGNQHPKQALADNVAAARKGPASTEQQVVFKTHSDAVRGNEKNARSRAGKDTKGNDERKRALKYLADHPEILNPKKSSGGRGGHAGGIFGTIDNALSGKLTAGAVDLANKGVDAAAPAVLAAARGPIGFLGDAGIKKVTGVDIGKFLSKEAKAAGKDIVDTPANAIPSLYVPAREAASGHPGKAAEMLAQPFIDTAKHPLKALAEHPVNTVLIARGAEGAVGHGIGKALRTAPSETLKKAGSVERRTAEIPNARTNVREDRTYSKDAIVMAGQKLRDKRRAAKGKEPAAGRITARDIERRANERVAVDEDVRRANRGNVVNEARTILDQRGPVAKIKGHRPSAATTAMAQHIADTPEELATYLDALKEAAKGLEGDKLRRNKQTQGLIEKALKHPGRLERNASQAAAYRDLSNRIQGDLAETGIIDPKQMENRRLLSYATSPAKGMGARMLTPEETKAHVETAVKARDTAKKAVKRAQRDVEKAKQAETEASGRAQILSRNVESTNAAERVAAQATRASRSSSPPPPEAQFIHVVRDTAVSAKAKMERIRQEGLKPTAGVERVYSWGPGHHDRAADFGKHGGVHLVVDGRGLEAHGGGAARTFAGSIPPERLWVRHEDGSLTPLVERGPTPSGGGHGIRETASRRAAAEAKLEESQAALKHAQKQLANVRKVHQQGGHLVDEAGVKVTRKQIIAHMAANGVEDQGAYVTHAPGKRGARNFYVDPTKAQGYFGPKATGAAVREGTLDLHPETMVEAVAHAQGLADSIHRFRGSIEEFAHRKPNGKVELHKTFQDAIDAAREMMVGKDGAPIPHAVEMRPVRINPLGGRAEQLRATLESVDHASAAKHISEAIDEALSGTDTGAGEWALIPAKAADTIRAHTAKVGTTTAGKVGQLYGSQFRKVVLSLSPKWLTGNIAEAALRSLVGHAGVRSYYTGKQVQKRYEALYGPEAAAELRSRTTGGGHYSLAHRTDVRRTAEDIAQAGDRIAKFAQAMGKLRRAPGAKQVADAWDGYTHIVMQSLNGRIEHQFQTAMFGKALREHPLMSDRTVKLSQDALADAAKGLSDTTAQVRLGREVDRMYGKYSKFSPGQRRLIAGYTPFIAWSLNTVRFLFDVLPRDHPVLTSVLASANEATEEWRQHHGLVQSFVENLAGAKKPFLQGSIPGKGDSNLRVSHYTPFGIYDQDGGLLGAFSTALLPQAEGVLKNLSGDDWKGDNLTGKYSKTTPTQGRDFLAAAMTVIENSVPMVSQATTLAGIHPPNEADGTQHPTSLGARARKAYDPFMYSQTVGSTGGLPSIKDILSGKVKLPEPSELPPLPKLK